MEETDAERKSKILERQVEYLALLQERNRLKKLMQLKTKEEALNEERERGFHTHFQGANKEQVKTKERPSGPPASVMPKEGAKISTGSDGKRKGAWAKVPPKFILGREVPLDSAGNRFATLSMKSSGTASQHKPDSDDDEDEVNYDDEFYEEQDIDSGYSEKGTVNNFVNITKRIDAYDVDDTFEEDHACPTFQETAALKISTIATKAKEEVDATTDQLTAPSEDVIALAQRLLSLDPAQKGLLMKLMDGGIGAEEKETGRRGSDDICVVKSAALSMSPAEKSEQLRKSDVITAVSRLPHDINTFPSESPDFTSASSGIIVRLPTLRLRLLSTREKSTFVALHAVRIYGLAPTASINTTDTVRALDASIVDITSLFSAEIYSGMQLLSKSVDAMRNLPGLLSAARPGQKTEREGYSWRCPIDLQGSLSVCPIDLRLSLVSPLPDALLQRYANSTEAAMASLHVCVWNANISAGAVRDIDVFLGDRCLFSGELSIAPAAPSVMYMKIASPAPSLMLSLSTTPPMQGAHLNESEMKTAPKTPPRNLPPAMYAGGNASASAEKRSYHTSSTPPSLSSPSHLSDALAGRASEVHKTILLQPWTLSRPSSSSRLSGSVQPVSAVEIQPAVSTSISRPSWLQPDVAVNKSEAAAVGVGECKNDSTDMPISLSLPLSEGPELPSKLRRGGRRAASITAAERQAPYPADANTASPPSRSKVGTETTSPVAAPEKKASADDSAEVQSAVGDISDGDATGAAAVLFSVKKSTGMLKRPPRDRRQQDAELKHSLEVMSSSDRHNRGRIGSSGGLLGPSSSSISSSPSIVPVVIPASHITASQAPTPPTSWTKSSSGGGGGEDVSRRLRPASGRRRSNTLSLIAEEDDALAAETKIEHHKKIQDAHYISPGSSRKAEAPTNDTCTGAVATRTATTVDRAERLQQRSKRIDEVHGSVHSALETLNQVMYSLASNEHSSPSSSTLNPARAPAEESDSRKSLEIDVGVAMTSAYEPRGLPSGRVLRLDIISTWGDEYYIGLNGIDIFDHTGALITLGSSPMGGAGGSSTKSAKENKQLCRITEITGNPSDINVLSEYGDDPRRVQNLVDGNNFTRDDLHVWLAPVGYRDRSIDSDCADAIATVTITFNKPLTLSMLRIFNYNKSRTHGFRGARHCVIKLDGATIFKGEIKQAPGLLESADSASEVILFTDDHSVMQRIARHDADAGYYADDTTEQWLAKLKLQRSSFATERPSTAEKEDLPFLSTYSSTHFGDSGMAASASYKNLKNVFASITSSIGDVGMGLGGSSIGGRGVHGKRPLTSAITTTAAAPVESPADNDPLDIEEDDMLQLLETMQRDAFDTSKNGDMHLASFSKSNYRAASSSQASSTEQLSTGLFGLREEDLVSCRRIRIDIESTWGDTEFCGLAGLQVLLGTHCIPAELESNALFSDPKDMSAVGAFDDPRVAGNLLNGINNTANDRFSWLFPFTPGASHKLEIDLGAVAKVAGLQVWNYNKCNNDNNGGCNFDELLRGIRRVRISVGSSGPSRNSDHSARDTLGHWNLRIGPGCDGVEAKQLILFRDVKYASPIFCPGISIATSDIQEAAAKPSTNCKGYITPAVKQDYEVQLFPSGLAWKFIFHENFNDGYYVGLDAIEFFDSAGKQIDVLATGAAVTAVPYSLADITESSSSQSMTTTTVAAGVAGESCAESDSRTPEKLFVQRKYHEKGQVSGCGWLAPLSRCMTVGERRSAGKRALLSSTNMHLRTLTYQAQKSDPANALAALVSEGTYKYPMDNTLFVMFNYPVTVSLIRIYNYSKTLARGVKELSIVLDNRVLFMGSLVAADNEVRVDDFSGKSGSLSVGQAIVFSNDPNLIRSEKQKVSYCGASEQDVLCIDERQVIVRSKTMFLPPNAASEGIYSDLQKRPTTGFVP